MKAATATTDEFATAFSALRLQAIAHGLEPNDDKMATFIVATANMIAQDRANAREAMAALHKRAST